MKSPSQPGLPGAVPADAQESLAQAMCAELAAQKKLAGDDVQLVKADKDLATAMKNDVAAKKSGDPEQIKKAQVELGVAITNAQKAPKGN